MEERIEAVRTLMKHEKLDALLLCSSHNIFYLTGFDGFGTHEREGYAFLTHSNLFIFTDPRLSEGARNNSVNTQVIELNPTQKLITTLQEICGLEKIKTIGFEEHLTYSEYERFQKIKDVKLKLAAELVETAREIKDINELTALQEACKLTDKTFSYVLNLLKIGVSETEIAWEMEKFIRENGGELAFPSIVAFGKNSAIPHHKSNDTKLEKDSAVLFDFGAKVKGYHADMTRTVFFGKADEKFKKMYETVKAAQEKGFIKTNKPFSGQDIDEAARNYIKSQGYPTIPHSVGHGVGLQVHELPHISTGFNTEILPNTPFTIEPGIYENGYAGVRIEDTVFFNGKEILALTKSPKTLTEI